MQLTLLTHAAGGGTFDTDENQTRSAQDSASSPTASAQSDGGRRSFGAQGGSDHGTAARRDQRAADGHGATAGTTGVSKKDSTTETLRKKAVNMKTQTSQRKKYLTCARHACLFVLISSHNTNISLHQVCNTSLLACDAKYELAVF